MWKKIDMEYLERYGISLPENLQQEIEGMSFVETAGYFKEHFQIPDSIEEIGETWNRMAWDKYMYEVPLKPGVMDFLHTCRSHQIKLGIASSNSSALIMNVLEAHHIRGFFDCIKSGTDVIKGKPAPDIYLHEGESLMKIIDLNEKTKAELLDNLLRRSPANYTEYENTVAEIIRNVREGKDKALFEYTEKFDHTKMDAAHIRVQPQEILAAYDSLDPELIRVMDRSGSYDEG